jgi:hypothetical protein
MNGFSVPVALLNFNRPQMTRQVFEIIRKIKPKRLLLIADGPRPDKPDDARLCAEVRAIFDEIDWDCEVSRRFSDTNLGSFKSNSTGLNWVFDTVEEAIIIEDDFLPSASFFPFCEELLEKYRYDQRVSVISANNFSSPPVEQENDSYYFSAYSLTWAWASWRRVWQQVDLTMSWWEIETIRNILKAVHSQPIEWQYWEKIYGRIRSGDLENAWDYQLVLSSFRYSQLCIVPRYNLITNIGYCADATHTTNVGSPLGDLPRGELDFPLKHPVAVKRSAQVDHEIFRVRYACELPVPILTKVYWIIASLVPVALRAEIKKLMRNNKIDKDLKS